MENSPGLEGFRAGANGNGQDIVPAKSAMTSPGVPGTPLVSVVIPCFRGTAFLSEAIESCIAQTYPSLEIVVVSDACPDGSAEIAAGYALKDRRVKLIELPRNRGISEALNAGFDAASGEYFSRLAQDDRFGPEAIATMVQYLHEHLDVGLVYCDSYRIDETGKIVGRRKRPEPAEVLRHGNKVGLCVMWRRQAWVDTGRFRRRYDSAEDYDYWVRLASRWKLGYCEGVAPFFFRLHTAMGSKVFSGKQVVLAARIQARLAETWVEKCRILRTGFFDAAFNFLQRRQLLAAWRCLIGAWVLGPWHWSVYRLAGRLALASFRPDQSQAACA
jgi:glycosyltransferase involved in cell wall biosynthesis